MGELKEGHKAPAFNLPSSEGKRVSLKDLQGKKLVLFFYPKDSTPGCTREACQFRDDFSEYAKRGAVVLGVSADGLKAHEKFIAKQELPFPLLSDEDHSVCEKYGVWQEKSLYGKQFMGIVRTTFVIDGDGRIAKIFPKVKVEGHSAEVLAVLDAIH